MRKTELINHDLKKYNDPEIRFIKILMDESTSMLVRHGESLVNAAKMSRAFVVEVCRRLGGSTLYLSKKYKSGIQTRDRIIQERINGGEKPEQLAIEYGLSTRRIYHIIEKQLDTLPDQDTNAGNAIFAVLAAHMLMKADVDQSDAISAARGLVALVTARIGGLCIYVPMGKSVVGILNQLKINRHYQGGKSIAQLAAHYNMRVDEIRTIIKNQPAVSLPNSSILPTIRTQLFNLASNFSGYAGINVLLGEATERISRAEEIITKLKGG